MRSQQARESRWSSRAVSLKYPRPEVKALLEPLIDFGVKSSEQAYADTLPTALKEAIAAHEVLVGMNHRMVLAALGAPENKMREQQSGDPSGGRYEEWIYGHVPQTIRFVRFVGDRVTVVEIAALGKPIEIHDKDEMGGFNRPAPTREVAMGDQAPAGMEKNKPAAHHRCACPVRLRLLTARIKSSSRDRQAGRIPDSSASLLRHDVFD